jgi:hypothetical protein
MRNPCDVALRRITDDSNGLAWLSRLSLARKPHQYRSRFRVSTLNHRAFATRSIVRYTGDEAGTLQIEMSALSSFSDMIRTRKKEVVFVC